MGLFGRSKRHTKGNFEEKNNYEYTNSKEEKISPNLLQHLTGENFHETHNLRFVCYDFAAKYQNAITLAVMGLFGQSKQHTKGNFEEK